MISFPKNVFSAFGILFIITGLIIPIQNLIVWGPEFVWWFLTSSEVTAEKISLGVFSNLALIHSITFPFGMNHIIKDLSKVCSLSLNESKNIRNDIDFSFENNQKLFDSNSYLKNTYFIDSKFRKISRNLIINVIKARLDEIVELLKKQLTISGLSLVFGKNILIKWQAFTSIVI